LVIDDREGEQPLPKSWPLDELDVTGLLADREVPGVHDHDHTVNGDVFAESVREELADASNFMAALSDIRLREAVHHDALTVD
jgi:hypothetical protein